MKYQIPWILFIAISLKSFSQGITQNAEGKSSIPLKGTIVGFDIGKTELTFSVNNIDRVIKTKKIKFLYGSDFKIKNEGGIASLFSAGSLVPSGNANFFGGVTFSNAFNRRNKNSIDLAKELNINYQIELKKKRDKYSTDFIFFLDSISKIIIDLSKRNNFNNNLKKAFENFKSDQNNNIEEFSIPDSIPIDTTSLYIAYESIRKFVETTKYNFLMNKTNFISNKNELFKKFNESTYRRITIFGFGGISAIQFIRLSAIDTSTLSKSFEDVYDRGGHIGIGVNFQFNGFIWAGISYSYERTNNFSNLKKKQYSLKKTYTTSNQNLTEQLDFTAYSGKFGSVEVNNLNLDLVLRFNLDKDHKNYLVVNPYFRSNILSRDTSLIINKSNLGTGLYFMQNKFLGGIYIELPDVNNNIEKAKPLEEQNLLNPQKRLSFGILAKFNLSTFMVW